MPSNSPVAKVPAILYGGDYNPEQWPEEVWQEDVRLMREAGVNFVSLAIFSWAKIQPDDKTYRFDWLDRIMDLLGKNGIWVDLATATASPPPWMSHYPDVLAVDANGCPSYHGSRQHYSPSSPTYRKFAAALVKKIAARYGNHPALAAWHINNEYACHTQECHSESSALAFREWLKRRYGTLAALNHAWYTPFWSQIYGDWNDILTPRKTPIFHNPTQLLDFRRFMSDAILDLCKMERDILRKATPDIPITTNFMSVHKPLNYWDWAKELDFTTWDAYPDPLPHQEPELFGAITHDLVRSLKPGKPFVLMEQVTSHVNWRPINATKPPGVMRLWSLQSIARGSDGVLFFQWRQSLGGGEKFHGAIIQHGALPEKARVFREVCELGAELKKLQPVTGSVIKSRVAITIDWNSWWALESPTKPAELNYVELIAQFHRYCYERNIAVDFVGPGMALDCYSLVIVPTLYLLKKEDAKNLDTFVRRGGALLATFFTGIVDENEHVVPGGYPAYLRETLGLWVEEWFPLGIDETRKVKLKGRKAPLGGKRWSEVIHPQAAEVLGTFDEGHLKGSPAFTRNRHEKGWAFYLGTQLTHTDLAIVLDQVCEMADATPPLVTPPGVEATVREQGNQRFLFLLNHNDQPVQVPLRNLAGQELLSGQKTSKVWKLPVRGIAAIRLIGKTSCSK